MEYGEKFRKSAFGGFKRQDVLQCIEELNAHHTEALEEKEAEKKELSEQLQALTEELEEQKRMTEKNEARTRDFAECQEKIERAIVASSELKNQLESQQKEIQALKAANSELSVKRSLLEENNRTLKARVEELEEEKSGRKTSIEIGEMMVEAKKTADGILSRASRQADAAHASAEAETAGISARLAEIRTQLSEASEDFKTCSASIIRSLSQMQRSIDDSRTRLSQLNVPEEKPAKPAPASKPSVRDPKSPYSFLFKK